MSPRDANALGHSHAWSDAARGRHPADPRARPATVYAPDRWLARAMLAGIGNPALAVALWNGEVLAGNGNPATGTLRISNRKALLRLLINPELHFGDLYSSGEVDIDGDLLDCLKVVYRAARKPTPSRTFRTLSFLRRYRPRRNTLARARRNIHHHYDIDGAFYRLWLDRAAMQYTCAYFPDLAMSLEEAQLAKMHHVCRKLRLQPEETVVEAGCGWGGLALFMAEHYGVKVRAYNISREQIVHARERLAAAGLAGRVEYVEDDYRNIADRYDAFVSVGMLEHVGPAHYHQLGKVIDRCLKDGGRGLIHSIGRNHPAPMNAWIEKRIFPGAYPPTLREMMEVFEPEGFSILDVENLRLHYARTLAHWLGRFDAHAERIRDSYDEAFVRAWRLYLTGSIAAFEVGALQLFQVVFTRAENNQLPWSRTHLYQ